MWITRCLPVCRGVVASHPLAVGIPAAISTIGAGAALAVMLSAPPAKPQLPCGCHQVWVAPVLPMTPAAYAQAVRTAGAVALAGIPLADSPGGVVYGTPASLVPANLTPADFSKPADLGSVPVKTIVPIDVFPVTPATPNRPTHPQHPVIPSIPVTPTNVPEPSTLALLAAALAGLVWLKRTRPH